MNGKKNLSIEKKINKGSYTLKSHSRLLNLFLLVDFFLSLHRHFFFFWSSKSYWKEKTNEINQNTDFNELSCLWTIFLYALGFHQDSAFDIHEIQMILELAFDWRYCAMLQSYDSYSALSFIDGKHERECKFSSLVQQRMFIKRRTSQWVSHSVSFNWMLWKQLQFKPKVFLTLSETFGVKWTKAFMKKVWKSLSVCKTKQQKWRAQLNQRANCDPKSSSNKKLPPYYENEFSHRIKLQIKKGMKLSTLLLFTFFFVIIKIILLEVKRKKLNKHTHMVCEMRKVTSKKKKRKIARVSQE